MEKCLFERYLELSLKLQYKYRLTREEARDAYTDAFLVVVQHIANQRFEEKSSLKTYLYRILRNKCVDIVRKNATIEVTWTEAFPELPDESKNFLRHMLAKEDWDTVREGFMQLGERCKELLEYVSEGYSPTEIAPLMGFKTPRSVSSQRYKCLEKLKEIIYRKPEANKDHGAK